MNILYRYLLIIIAGIALLLGIQIPNLADQYEKRVDAHLREVKINLQPFQDIADKYFGGSLEKLIELHHKSEVKAFQDEGAAIEDMVKRRLRFEADLAALQVSLPMKVVHILFNGDREMIDETLEQYTYAVPLNQDAVMTGAVVAAVILLALELLLALVRYISEAAIRHLRRPSGL
ncbi:MAG TPA: DUF2937 family protein [Gallionellaceae bacterium]|nr:DUF2937 family protein [Gallionellaceae bacterium]